MCFIVQATFKSPHVSLEPGGTGQPVDALLGNVVLAHGGGLRVSVQVLERVACVVHVRLQTCPPGGFCQEAEQALHCAPFCRPGEPLGPVLEDPVLLIWAEARKDGAGGEHPGFLSFLQL